MSDTKFSYKTITPAGEVLAYHDFIQHSDLHYYYEASFSITPAMHQRALWAFDGWRREVWQGRPDFSWDQFTKLPYLRQSLLEEKSLRFPIIFHDDIVCCGNGRVVTIGLYCADLPTDRVICSTRSLDLHRLHSMADLERVLLAKPFFQRVMHPTRGWNWMVDQGVIRAHDISRTNNTFPFCKNSERNQPLLSKIKHLVLTSHDRSITDLLEEIGQLDTRRSSPR